MTNPFYNKRLSSFALDPSIENPILNGNSSTNASLNANCEAAQSEMLKQNLLFFQLVSYMQQMQSMYYFQQQNQQNSIVIIDETIINRRLIID